MNEKEYNDNKETANRLVICEENTMSISFTTKQVFFKAVELLEDRGREFLVVTR